MAPETVERSARAVDRVIRGQQDGRDPRGVGLVGGFSADVPVLASGVGADQQEVVAGVDEDWLRLDVTDTGIGIAPDRIEAIFEQFAQADENTAGRYGGTGLGLAISGNLAQLMGGSISAASVLGAGSTFSVVVPLRKVGDGVAAAPVPRPVPRLRPGRTPLVLVAEDHDINQALMMAMADRAGMEAHIAADGLQAIAMVEEASRAGRPFDLVLMDMQMPNLDGLEATRRLRLAGFGPDVLPIVALTANAYEEDIRACLDAGMQAHLGKPVGIHELTAILTRFIRADNVNIPPESFITPKLRDRYNARKAEVAFKLERIAAAERPDAAIVDEAMDVLHKLAGTAAMFGDAALGEQAKHLEDALMNWSTASSIDPIRAAVFDLLTECRPAAGRLRQG